MKDRPWATVYRVPLAGGAAFFKACRPIQAFEPRLSAALASRWPARVATVIAHDEARSWLLTADAGVAIGDNGNPPERWAELLPRYAELQRGEIAHAQEHLAGGVPDFRSSPLAERFETLAQSDLPLKPEELLSLRGLAPALAVLTRELDAGPIPASIEHADLHLRSVFIGMRDQAGVLRVLDWGDAVVGHPFFSPFITFHFLREVNRLAPDDPWLDRLRDAYLEPWGSGLVPLFESAQRVAAVARALGWLRHRQAMGVGAFPAFDEQLPGVLRTAIAALGTTLST